MADSTKATRSSQWKCYLNFCDQFDMVPLPATLETILMYLAYLAESKAYNSIVNYLSAVWTLHKLNNFPHIDPSTFEIVITLRGIKRVLGNTTKEARPISVKELRRIFSSLDLLDSEDVALWLACILCFRGLLRKSNVCEVGLAVLISDVEFHDWGVLINVRRTKTISFRERVLQIPFNTLSDSIFCVNRFIRLLYTLVTYPSSDSQLVGYMQTDRWVRGSYSWLQRRLTKLCSELDLVRTTSHSFRRGCATSLADANFSVLDIRNLGDWASLSMLRYISKSVESRRDLDRRLCDNLFAL